ncbi:hypothetical protein V8E54_009792 [Elaphomyces granulatus]
MVFAIPVNVKAPESAEEEKIKSPFLEVDMNHPVTWLIPVSITLIGVLTLAIYVVRILAKSRYPRGDGTAESMERGAYIIAFKTSKIGMQKAMGMRHALTPARLKAEPKMW